MFFQAGVTTIFYKTIVMKETIVANYSKRSETNVESDSSEEILPANSDQIADLLQSNILIKNRIFQSAV